MTNIPRAMLQAAIGAFPFEPRWEAPMVRRVISPVRARAAMLSLDPVVLAP